MDRRLPARRRAPLVAICTGFRILSRSSCIAFVLGCGVVAGLILSFPHNVYGALLACVVVRIVQSDLTIRIVPDMDVAAIFIGGVAAILAGASTGDLQGAGGASRLVDVGLTAAALGGGLLAIAAVFKWFTGEDGLGLGDTKLLVAWSSWLPIMAIIEAVTMASLAAIAMILAARSREHAILTDRRFPFAAVLAPTLWLAWIFTQWAGAAG